MKRILTVLAVLCWLWPVAAQTGKQTSPKPNPHAMQYEKEWDALDTMLAKESYNTAYEKARQLFSRACAENDSRQMLVGAYYLASTEAAYREASADSVLRRYTDLLPKLQPTDAALCRIFLAKGLSLYRDNHRWTLQQNRETGEADLDFALWPLTRFDTTIATTCREALRDASQLQSSSVATAERLLRKSGRGTSLTPTLYDVVVNEVFDMTSDHAEKLRLLQELREFHRDDEVVGAHLALRYIDLMESCGTPLDTEALVALFDRYRHAATPDVALLCYRVAARHNEGQRYEEALRYCDTATQHFANSEGAAHCQRLREEITLPSLSVTLLAEAAAERPMLAVTTCRNTTRLHFRIVADPSDSRSRYNIQSSQLRKAKPLQAWTQDLPHEADHVVRNYYSYLPALPPGRYCLLVSATADFERYGLASYFFSCCDAKIVVEGHAEGSHACGYVLHRTTGAPIAGQKVELVDQSWSSKKVTIRATTQTDSNGLFCFARPTDGKAFGSTVRTRYHGVETQASISVPYERQRTSQVQLSLFADRPVYKPGETLTFALLCYTTNGHSAGHVLADETVEVWLSDVNGRELERHVLQTDAYGMASDSMPIPADALPGQFLLSASHKGASHVSQAVKVEAYKQPKFMVQLNAASQAPQLEQSYVVTGLAASYSDVPLSGALVSYTVERTVTSAYGWWWRRPLLENRTTVAQGHLHTDAQGRFEIDFVPTADSSVDRDSHPCFFYTLTAVVTDLNGESHEATLRLRAGYTNLLLSAAEEEETDTFDSVRYSLTDLNGRPVTGSVDIRVERLRLPSTPLLSHPLLTPATQHTLDPRQFAQAFPGHAYTADEASPLHWPAEAEVAVVHHTATAQTQNVVPLRPLSPGIYRVSLQTHEGNDTLRAVQIVRVRPADRQAPATEQLLWSHLSGNGTAEVGSHLVLHLGSRHADQPVLCLVGIGAQVVRRQWLRLDHETRSVDLPVDSSMLGGFDVTLLAVRDNTVCRRSYHVDVPYTHKTLSLTWSTFRDKVQPGDEERWTLRIADHRQQAADASLMLTLYDAALNTYGQLQWNLTPWYANGSVQRLATYSWNEHGDGRNFQTRPKTPNYKSFESTQWELRPLQLGGWWGRGHVMYKSMSRSAAMAVTDGAVAEEKVMLMADAAPMSANGVATDFSAKESAVEQEAEEDTTPNATPVDTPIRQQLHPSALFLPQLTTDSDGAVSVSFRVPDLLTTWHLSGLAHTRDLKTGTIGAAVVSRKELMVEPYVPRFLRQGDTTTFQAKVSNTTDSEQTVQVQLRMTDAATGDDAHMIQGDSVKTVVVPPHGSVAVAFPLVIPYYIYVCTYRVEVCGDRHSDGEQAQIPVLTNRTLVTESMSMYVNGRETKHYTLPHLRDYHSSTLQHRALTVEFTANPVWYAILSLPYLGAQENPSNLYRANRMYASAVSLHLLENNPTIEPTLQHWRRQEPEALIASLERNEDVKQTLLHETPWLGSGEGESSQMLRTAQHFNRADLGSSLHEAAEQLTREQRADGGWSWMPGGQQASEYVTADVLQLCGHLALHCGSQPLDKKVVERALSFLDKKNYDYYLWLQKHAPTAEVDNIQYLYVRSFYADATRSKDHDKAYQYFYRNAKKHRNTYSSLYSRAQLALVLWRNGDRTAARDMVHRLKECALQSDEMGMYWRDNTAGYLYHQIPVVVQTLLIEAFSEITPDDKEAVARMQQWLLKQKQTTQWESDVATTAAVRALLASPQDLSPEAAQSVTLTVGGEQVETHRQQGTGYQLRRWPADSVTRRQSEVEVSKSSDGIAWGALYWQYFEDFDKVPASEMGVKLQKRMYRVETDGTLTPADDGSALHVGDKVRVRILLQCDRNLEFVELRDGRPASFEPVSSASGWHWNGGLSFYCAVYDASTSFFLDRIEKGDYVIESDYYVTHTGQFSAGLCTAQCLYSPEFRATAAGMRVSVE